MDMTTQLEALRERALTLEDTIQDIDYQIEKAMHAVAAGTSDVGHALSVLESRRNDQAGLMFELGKVTAQIEDFENRIREQEERPEERQSAMEWEERAPVADEDHLDWLRPTLDVTEHEQFAERHPHYDAEDRMLAEMHRQDREPEDYLDWWKR
ncbi:hypothetical protein SAMN05892877_1413 [Rhizobium subbaraonis]|uniref:Uncharacterized protein n=1 Tax=Rhizobium subbaraonis TaxID=908946 RepID=A0A285V279_9HYPH|nr:hypothetical protein [Rhizobium subbaraonis]SOC48159.1 hypothetical protein SAMN05892877_1413 [Rhizobium subbaraonis]